MDGLGDRGFLCEACDDYAVALSISLDDPILSIESESVVRSLPKEDGNKISTCFKK
tara:strand:- start:273 stop:440 length:168 start_codon:yes stop_codon:yes gene_type:complete